MSIISTNKTTATRAPPTCIALDGVAKKMMASRRFPRVRVVKEKSKKPDPLECMVGGLMNIDTSSRTHQRKVTIRKSTETKRSALTDQRL
jgi:hypothetical protein